MRILLVCNNAHGKVLPDGQHIKTRTYYDVFKKEHYDVELVDLDKPFKNIFKILSGVKKGIKWCDVIVLVTCDNGERILVPYINMLNKKFHKRFVFSNIGSGSLYPYIKKLNDKEIYDFFHKHDFYSIKPRKSNIKQLKKIDVILNETQLIADATNAFFGLSNCHAMTNFRDFEINQIAPKNNVDFAAFKIVFFARVCTLKGIFDLMDVVIKLKSNYPGISLDIYGMKQFNDDESTRFDSIINSCNNITYKGIAKLEDAINVLSQYDLLCFPTRAITEGVPGTIVESLIAKTPILTSNFTQSTELLSDGANALFFDIFNVDDLESKLVELLTNYDLYYKIKDGAAKLGNKYLYSTNRDMFLKYICGDDIVKEGK